ncbi:MAG: T9SS type A sorting domain-containing protein [Paludibacteraceae bacterium]|nr:T9SS type A sorting domain-containing protein [Paludibacteraceae bacterium]
MRCVFSIVALMVCLSAYSIPKPNFHSNGDYGFEYLGRTKLPTSVFFKFGGGISDKNGNFYCLFGGFLQKISVDGEYLWQIEYKGEASKISFIDGDLFLPIKNEYKTNVVTYGDNTFETTNADSYFLLKIDSDNGSIKNSFELEVDDFVEDGFDPFDQYRNGYAISKEGDLFFMFDINENYSRVNKDNEASFQRYGDNDKCLFVLSKDLELKKAICLGSDQDDETEYVRSEHLSPYMTFAGDTLFMYVPFLGKECNVSLDPENPVIAQNKSSYKKACAALCKYLVEGDNIELLAYNVINERDGQIKRFAVNSHNRVVACQPEWVFDGGNDSFYDIQPDMTLKELQGYAYVPTGCLNYTKQEPRFLFDENDDIIRIGEPSTDDEIAFAEGIVFPPSESLAGSRMAKYDGETLEFKWLLSIENSRNVPLFRVCAAKGLIYMIVGSNCSIDFDPTEGSDIIGGDHIARYIETYRIKTSSEHASIVVNEGNDMVRHGSDAEVVISAEKGYHVKSVTTSKGDDVEVSKNGHCTIKNVTEPVELVITTALGENAVNQYSSAVLDVYPNPVKDLLNVDDTEDASYEIFDLSGNIVCSGVVSDGKIVTSELSEGVYVLTIKKEIGAYSTKIVKK